MTEGSNGETGDITPDPPPSPKRRVSKTKLDHSLMQDQVLKSVAKLEEKVAEQVKQRTTEPGKSFNGVQDFKAASPCPFKWEGHDPRLPFKHCERCQIPLYDFHNVELSEIEQIIFKRENRENAPLFKREDGKFMTQDCPVACKKRRERVMLVGAVVAAVIAVAAWMILVPSQPPSPPPAVIQQEQPAIEPSTQTSQPEQENSDGSWEHTESRPLAPESSPAPAAPQ
jgi:hypothetical protein